MTNVFMDVVDMSITATFVAAIIVALRWFVGKGLPRSFSYGLWGIVLFRLVTPFSFPALFSFPSGVNLDALKSGGAGKQGFLNPDALQTDLPAKGYMGEGLPLGDATGVLTPGTETLMARNDILAVFAAIWLMGTALLLIYGIISYIRMTRKVSCATLLQEKELLDRCRSTANVKQSFDVYVSENVESPFVYGLFKPRIIIPSFLLNGKEGDVSLQHILLHEMVHIRRFDFFLRQLSFLALIIHWFNPVVWLCFYLSGKDMEMSCDEAVINKADYSQRGTYANTLLNISIKHNYLFGGGILAFGESDVEARVKNILKYKSPRKWVTVTAVAAAVVLGILLLSNPVRDKEISVLFMGVLEGTNPMADTFIIANYDSETGNLNLASVPRDTAVTAEGGQTKLNAYAATHSPEQVLQKLNEKLGINISNYVKMDTSLFREFIDSIGGVEFDVPMDMYYDDSFQNLHIDLKKGMQVLDGKNAEMLVRYRKGYAEGDFTRMDVQKDLISAVLTQTSTADLIKNVDNLYKLDTDSIETNVTLGQLKNAYRLLDKDTITSEDIKIIKLSVSMEIDEGIAYAVIDEEQAKELLSDKF